MRVPAGRRAAGLAIVLTVLLAAAAPLAAQEREAIDRLLFEAERRQREGDLAGALRNYELLCEQFPAAPAAAQALLRLLEGYLELDREDEAEAAARRLISAHPQTPQAAGGYTRLGELLAAAAGNRQELTEARSTFDNAVLLFSRAAYPGLEWRSAAAVASARLALQLGLDGEAAQTLTDVIDLEPDSFWSASARFELAHLLLDRGRWLEAAELLQEVAGGAAEDGRRRALAALAAARLDLIHRFWLRPASGRDRWLGSRLVGAAPERASAVAAAADGRVAVTAADGSTMVLDAAGSPVGRWSLADARRNSWNGDQLLVATPEAIAVLPDGGSMSFAAPQSEKKPTLMPLEAAEPAAFGHWFVLVGKPERLRLYEPLRRRSSALIETKGREPVDIARDRRGRLLVLDGKAREITRFSAAGEGGERVLGGGWRRPAALAVDVVGNLYVLDRDSGVTVFGPGGEPLGSLGPLLPGGLELRRPLDLAVDGAGRLWIADGRLGLVVVE